MNRNRLWHMALDALKAGKRTGEGYHQVVAWTYLQMAMGKPASQWNRVPPRVTVGAAS